MFVDIATEKFKQINEAQEAKGLKKYGHEVKPLEPKWDWLEMAEQELVDGFKYLVAEKERRDFYIRLALTQSRSLHGSFMFMAPEEVKERLKNIEQSLLILLGGKE